MLAQYQLDSVDLLDAGPDCPPGEVPLDYGTGDYAPGHVLNVALCFLLDLRALEALRPGRESVG